MVRLSPVAVTAADLLQVLEKLSAVEWGDATLKTLDSAQVNDKVLLHVDDVSNIDLFAKGSRLITVYRKIIQAQPGPSLSGRNLFGPSPDQVQNALHLLTRTLGQWDNDLRQAHTHLGLDSQRRHSDKICVLSKRYAEKS